MQEIYLLPLRALRPLELRVTADINTWSPQGGHCDFAVGKQHKTNFKLGMCLTGPKLDVKNKKKAFVYCACFVKLRRAVNLLYFPNPNNTKETIPVLVVF